MSKLTKNQKLAAAKIEEGKAYTVAEAAALVKEITTTKFDASVDIDVRLGVDPRKANQMVRGVVSLPNGTGKVVRVLALCTPDQEAAAKENMTDVHIEAFSVEILDERVDTADVVLLGPQIRHMLEDVKKVINGKCPVDVIDMRDYGNVSKLIHIFQNSLEGPASLRPKLPCTIFNTK